MESTFKKSFWRDVLTAWAKYAYIDSPSHEQLVNQMIWYNSKIKSNNKILHSKKAFKAGLRRVSDLTDGCRFLTPQELSDKYGISLMFANTIVTSIPREWKSDKTLQAFPELTPYDNFVSKTKVVHHYYEKRIENKSGVFDRYVKWQPRLHTGDTYQQFLKLFQYIYVVTNHSKLRSFQYRLLNDAIITNRNLKMWGILSSDKCTFCDIETETIVHLMFDCEIIQKVWKKIEAFCHEEFEVADQLCFTAENVIYNRVHKNPAHIVNFVVLAVKMKIYTHRCCKTNPTFYSFTSYINECKQIEKYNAIRTNNVSKYVKKWVYPEAIEHKIGEFSCEEYAMQYIEQLSQFE